jgi:D-alanine-D-alanine ligase
MNVAVLFGGISPERNVSINGGKAVVKALQEKGHNVIPIDPALGTNCVVSIDDLISGNGFPTLEELAKFSTRSIIDAINSPAFDNIDIAFLVLHGANGEDGRIQALLELRGIPYTGSNVKASAVAIDKAASKMLFEAARIQTAPWLIVRPKDYDNFELIKEIRSELGNHLVIKPNDQGSTIGISFVESGNLDDIHNGILLAGKYSEIVIVETFIEGRELTVPIIGGMAYPVIEIKPHEGQYDYEHKYTKGKTDYICPAELTEDVEEFIQHLALLSFQVIGCSGFARADFRLDEDNQPFILEINTIPGFTSTSLVPMSAKEAGIEFPELCENILNITLGKETEAEETI